MKAFFNIIYLLLFAFLLSLNAVAQNIVINEVMTSNKTSLQDEDSDFPDWVELYNKSNSDIDLTGYGLSDKKDSRWIFPVMTLSAGGHLLIFASDKNRTNLTLNWETIITEGDNWQYLVPTQEPDADWKNLEFDDSEWSIGASGFGYGDNDDATILPGIMSVFIRKSFEIADLTDIGGLILDIDYDDAFVAYINGQEVARANTSSDGSPSFNQPADNFDHEAGMYQGLAPDRFDLGGLSGVLLEGQNVLAIQIHNHSTGSSDLTAIPFLSIGHVSSGAYETAELLNFPKFGGLHSDFKLSNEGETIYVTKPDGSHEDSLQIGPIKSDLSYGRAPDGSENFGFFIEPSPGKMNALEANNGFSGDVIFSTLGGIYQTNVSLILNAAENESTIYYTLDGSTPTTLSQIYDTPILIEKTTVINAMVTESGKLPGKMCSQTYLINVSHGDLPIVSISTDSENLWNWETGIYVLGPNAEQNIPHFGANFWMDWEIPINIQLIEPDGGGFSMNAGAKIFGAWSRANDQKSFAIHFRDNYEGDLNYRVFPEQDMEVYHSLVLRNSGNDWNRTMIRDGFITSLVHEDIDQQVFRPSVAYLNGEYWGILNIREKVNEDFLAEHHGIKAANIQLLEANGYTLEGDNAHFIAMRNFINLNNMALDEKYEYVQTQMDVQNFIKYQVVNIFINNIDWPGNNIKFWREDKPGAIWKWISYDRDFSFNIFGEGNSGNNLKAALATNGPDWPNPPWSTLLLRRLIQNQSFKTDFLNFFADELNTTYKSTNVVAEINKFSGLIKDEIGNHGSKWGSSLSNWNYEISTIKNFANVRDGYVWGFLEQEFSITKNLITFLNPDTEKGFIRVNSLELEDEKWSGYYFNGVPIEITAVPKPGNLFVGWEGYSTARDTRLEIDPSEQIILKAIFAAGDENDIDVVINEIKYKSSDLNNTDDWVELTNNSETSIDLSGWSLMDDAGNTFSIPQGVSLAFGEFLVVAKDASEFKSVSNSEIKVIGSFEFGLSSNSECVMLYDANGALRDEVCYSSTAPWPALDGDNYSIGLNNPNRDNSSSENWIALENGGTPGAKNTTYEILNNVSETSGFLFYPNPTSNFGYLNLVDFKDSHGSVSLYDLSGKLVSELFDGDFTSENLKLSFDRFAIHSGVYFLEIKNQNISKTIRVILN